MSDTTRQADAVIQELWRVKDAAFEAAGKDPKRFVQLLRERSASLRRAQQAPPPKQADQQAATAP